jgi:hypothetical protein
LRSGRQALHQGIITTKADIYAAGVILFEMWWVMSTDFERVRRGRRACHACRARAHERTVDRRAPFCLSVGGLFCLCACASGRNQIRCIERLRHGVFPDDFLASYPVQHGIVSQMINPNR